MVHSPSDLSVISAGPSNSTEPEYGHDLVDQDIRRSAKGGLTTGYCPYTLVNGFEGSSCSMRPTSPSGHPCRSPFDISGAAASPDGRFFTVGRLGGFVDLYAAPGELITRLEVRDTAPAGTTGPSFTDEGRFVSASVFNKEGKIALWSTDTLERLDFHVGSDWTTAKLAGSWLAVNRGGSSILLIDPASSEPVGDPLLNTAGRVTSVVIDAEAARLAALAGDTVTAWDLESGLQLGRELPARPLSIEYCADGTILIVPGEGRLSSTESANSSTRSQLTPVYTAVPRFDPGSPASLDHLEENGYVVIAYDVSESTGHPGGRRSVAPQPSRRCGLS